MHEGLVVQETHRRLPHWRVPDGTYLVTFRLADSLPRDVAKSLAAFAERVSNDDDRTRLLARAERYLDAGYGECLLSRPDCADMVRSSLQHFDRQRYLLGPWTVMPNHVHSVIKPLSQWRLEDIIGDIRSFTAHKINKLLCRSGRLWSKEPHDSWIRDLNQYSRARDYVLNNPIKAGLKDWEWVGDPDVGDLLFPGRKAGEDARGTRMRSA